jgi:hypothetical protein
MIICAFENSPSIPSFLMTKIVYIGYGQLKKNDSFSFDLSIAVLIVFLYFIAAYASFIQQQHSSVLKPKYSLSIRNKCAYLLESSETSITIWHQEYPQHCYI